MAWVENAVLEFSDAKRFTLYAISDFQIGSSSCDMRLIKRKIKEICADPNAMVVILGDIEDDDRPTTRIARNRSFADRPEVISSDAKKHMAYVKQEVMPVLAPLAKLPIGVLGVLAGHHWTQLASELNSVQYICQQLSQLSGKKVPYLGEMSGWLYLRFRGKGKFNGKSATRLVHMQHGVGGGQTLASALSRLERTAQGFPADVYLRAHDCKLVAAKSVEVYPKDTQGTPCLLSRDVTFLNIGSATRGYNLTTDAPDYVEAEMMRPTAMGWGEVHFDVRGAYMDEDPSRNLHVDIKVTL